MERLTFNGDFCDIAQCFEIRGGKQCPGGYCSQRRVWDRLKEYEDTGLEPETVVKARDIILDISGDIDHLRELVREEKNGRLMVLPVKIGEHLWRATKPYRQEPKVTEYVVKNIRTVGKKHKVMLEVQAVNVPVTNVMHISSFCRTREEAEAALEARGGQDG